jgi:phenylacetate-coenzyme A ligase PaaK-like adenylate-forming protein
MLKVQKLLNFVYQNTKERDIIKKYKELKRHSHYSKEKIQNVQLNALNKILNHCFTNVPYYKNIFIKSGIVNGNFIALTSIDQLSKVKFLTKDIIRQEKNNLYSNDINKRKSYKNSSGGSTGEPLVFMQDRNFQINSGANFNIIRSWRGADPYDSTIMLWGAERDTFEGKKPLIVKLQDFVLNLNRLNTFTLDSITIKKYIKILNRDKPKLIIAYAQSIYEIAKFAKNNRLKIQKQKAVHTGAGTMYSFMRDEIESVFQCKLYNHYGSREVASIASECNAHDGLHILMEHTLVEVVNKNGNLCKSEEEGEIVVTTLNNYSMPLIRYKIGDIGVLQKYKQCSCRCNYPKLQKVIGRTTDVFKTPLGSIVIPEFFIHLIGVVCNKGNIKCFQVIQEEIELIVIKIVKEGEISKADLSDIEKKIKIVMGNECKVVFEFVDHIPKTKTGKFLYTISKV